MNRILRLSEKRRAFKPVQVVLGMVLFWPAIAGACDDPSLHPELATYAAARASFGEQAPSPVEVKFRVAGDRRIGSPVRVQLSFWPNDDYDGGYFTVTPSAGIRLDGFSGEGEIPFKGVYDFGVIPVRRGYHYVTVETVVNKGDREFRRGLVLPLPVSPEHSPATVASGTAGLGFAGARLREAMLTNGSAAHRIQSEAPTQRPARD